MDGFALTFFGWYKMPEKKVEITLCDDERGRVDVLLDGAGHLSITVPEARELVLRWLQDVENAFRVLLMQ